MRLLLEVVACASNSSAQEAGSGGSLSLPHIASSRSGRTV